MTNPVEAALRRVAGRLDSTGVGWALVGGFAVSARSEPRFTRDVDACVLARDDAAAERLVGDLVNAGYRVHTLVEQDAVHRLATVRLSTAAKPDSGVVVDLLFASSGIEPEIVAMAERLEILPGLSVPVAIAGHLVVLKLLARDDQTRPQDHADLIVLRPVLTVGDREAAAAAVRLVVDRGYARGRDLVTLLDTYLLGRVS